MSKGKKLAICAGILLVLCVALIVISVLQNNGVLPTEESSAEESSSTLLGSTQMLLEHDRLEIASITLENSEVEFTLISRVTTSKDEYGNEKTEQEWIMEGHEDWNLASAAVTNLTAMGASLRSVTTIVEKNETVSLANYGLETPVATVTVKYTDGTQVQIYLGNFTPDGSYLYARLSDRDGIYTVYKSISNYISYNLTSLRSIAISQINTQEELDYILMEKKDSRTIEVVRKPDDYEAPIKLFDMSYFLVTQPYQWDAVVAGDMTTMLESMPAVTIDQLAASNVEDLDAYGLGDENFEHHVIVRTRAAVASENPENPEYEYHTTEYYFGIDAGDDLVYFREAGSNDVFTVAKSILETFNFNPYNYIQHLIYLFPIDQLDHYTVTGTAEGLHYEGSILRQDPADVPVSEESSEDPLQVFYLDGKLVEESDFKTQYQRLIGIFMDYEIDTTEGLPEYDEKDKVTIEYFYTDGTSRTVEYYRLSEFYYGTPYGEGVWMGCSTMQFEQMWKGFEDLAASADR